MGKRYYDNYDYEEAYKEQCKKLEEAEMERWMKEGWVNCLYRTSTYKSTNTESNTTLLESMVYPSFKFKRYTNEVLAFSMVKEEELLRATEEIQNLTYRQGEYKIFKVFEPKERLIMALPFYDRVVQHMICNAIQPVFENGFYYHSYACRSGKGMHAASDTLYQWMYETEVKQGLRMYAFKGDISKYFASIPHDKLKDENRRYIGDKKALMLMDDIIDHNGILPDGVGIPVGNLTSQLFANVYGNKLDKFCKHVLHIPYFVRYMDDFIILSDDLEQLKEWVKRIEEFLENEMLLHINPKSTILYAGNGIDFCGYIHYADHKKVRKSSIRKLKQDVKAYELGELPPEEFNRKYESRKGHLGHADTYHIAKAVEYELLFYEWERLEATA